MTLHVLNSRAQQLQQQMMLCPVRVVYETQILVQPGTILTVRLLKRVLAHRVSVGWGSDRERKEADAPAVLPTIPHPASSLCWESKGIEERGKKITNRNTP
jgi:hypothetical protein